MFAKINSLGLMGLNAFPVEVEIESSKGIQSFDIVGLADVAVRESRERIRSALRSSNISFPTRKIMVNLAPADKKKSGSVHDLGITVALLAVLGFCDPAKTEKAAFIGEVSLSGEIRAVQGVLPMTILAHKLGLEEIYVPFDNAREAAVVEGIKVYGVESVAQLVLHFSGKAVMQPASASRMGEPNYFGTLDFADVKGQQNAKKALEIAAAGGHNMIMVGPPGAGKSMIAKRIPSILPPLTLEEALETTKIHSIAGLTNKKKGARGALIVQRPFRSPHHTITDVALVGGGQNPHPGEISLAHNGVLFLDELPEYKRSALEVMRQPLEDRKITVARAKDTVEYPASFMLVAAMNPCPCGHYGENNPAHPCTCTPAQVHRYMSKISGPLLDRIDIQCEIEAVPYEQLRDTQPGESSEVMRARVLKARAIQNERFKHSKLVHCNAMMNSKMVREYCALDEECDKLLEFTMSKLGLSARAYDRILKVARTIADIEGAERIQKKHLLEAISYRSLDRSNYFG